MKYGVPSVLLSRDIISEANNANLINDMIGHMKLCKANMGCGNQ